MKTITSIIVLGLSLLFYGLNAQTLTEHQRCGTEHMHQQLQQKFPNQVMSRQQFESWMDKEIQNRKNNKQGNVAYTIPIIFHIIHDGSPVGTGINIAQIYVDAQIEQLNNDFRKIVGTSGNNNNPVGADTEVDFCAAELDPNGVQLAEPGINRIDGTVAGYGNPPYVNADWENVIKPATQWDPLNYFNVWVSDLSSGLLGYAQFPDGSTLPGMPGGGAANTDGCVVLYTSVGSSVLPHPGGGNYAEGRTLTHEAGHWLGLRHVWGDGPCGTDDFCADTPESDGSNFGCATGHMSCGTLDMVENYMDYSDDDCMNIFTLDQKTRIQTVMLNSPRRKELANSGACNPNCQASVTSSVINSNCGGATGSITVNITNGTPPYTFQWDAATGGQVSSTAINLLPGTYSCTITDAIGCLKFVTETVVNFGPVVNVNLNAPASCYTSSDGALVAVATSGMSPYSYLWSNGNVTSSPFFLPIGNYTVSVTDANGCVVTASGTVISPPEIMPNSSSTPENCAGKDGTATVTPTGGSGTGYTYMWGLSAGGQMTQTAVGLTIGTYEVTITDSDGCSTSAIVQVGGANGPSLNTSSTQAACNMSNGTATATATGTSPFIYQWDANAGNQTTPTAINLAAGTYTVIVTDGNNCSTLVNVTVTENCTGGCTIALSTNNIVHETCQGLCNGSATVGVTGGVPPFMFLWSDGQNTQTGTNLCGGMYSIVVTDATGCVETVSVIINSGSTVSAAANTTNTTCAGNDGTATVIPSNGQPPFSYLWGLSAGNQATGTAVNLPIGNHTVTITDNNGCNGTLTVTIADGCICNLSVTTTSTPTTCAGNDGTASVNPTGGTMPLTLLWSPSAGNQTTPTAINLPIGTHSITVTDANGCQETSSVSVADGCVCNISASVTTTSTTCAGSDGTATVNPSGGTVPYTYIWSPSAANQATQTANNLPIGLHTTTVTDANGCTQTANAVITNGCNCSLTVTTASTATTCAGNDGTATATPAGGVPPFFYLWSLSAANQTIQTAINLPSGIHSVTVADASGCVQISSVTVADGCNCTLTATTSTTATTCAGNDGTATATPGGGTGPMTYQWGATTGNQITQTAINLPVGMHSVTVSDANGCTQIVTATITDGCNCNLTGTGTATSASCLGNDGTATATPAGGTGPFTYLWDAAASNQVTQTAINLSPGSYNGTITDANGCVTIINVTVNNSCNCNITAVVGTTNANCGTPTGSATASTAGGLPPFTFIWSTGGLTQTILNLTPGPVTVTVTDAAGCTQVATAIVGDVGTLNAAAVATDLACNGDLSGAATVTNPGALTYLWSTGAMTAAINGLPAGVYSVTVSQGSCVDIETVTVNEPAVLSGILQANNNQCTANGASASAILSGGTIPYTYLWNTGDVTSTIGGLPSGNYTCTATDTNGCTTVITGNVTSVNNSPVLNPSFTNVTCNGSNDGVVSIVVANGTPPFTYDWGNGLNVPSISGLAPGSYTVEVTDSNSCIAFTTVQISEPTPMSLTFFSTPTTGSNDDGSASVNVAGGVPPYTYQWNDGQTTQIASGLAEGTYSVLIADANGCIIQGTVDVQMNTSTIDLDQLAVFELYPNPSNGVFSINIEFLSDVDASIQLYSVVGQQLLNRELSGRTFTLPIDMSDHAGGIYLAKLSTAEGDAVIRFVITE